MRTTASLNVCKFSQGTGTLVISSSFFDGKFPEEVTIHSDITGNDVRFHQDHEAAARNEWWDGEMYEYFPLDPTNNCNRLVVTADLY